MIFFKELLGLLDEDIRVNAARLNGSARRRVIARRGQAHGAMPAEKDDWPILLGAFPGTAGKPILATGVHDLLLDFCRE